jgi:hypothetical protein
MITSQPSLMPLVSLALLHLKKCSAAIRMLSYGVASDLVDEYLQMRDTTCLESIYNFCKAMIVLFGTVYLREPTVEDTAHLLSIKARGFQG